MRIVVVRSGQDLVPFAQRQPMIKKSRARGGVLRQCVVLRVAAGVVGQGTADLPRDIFVSVDENRVLNGKQWVCIYFRPVLLYRLTHGSRVGGQKK